MFGRQTKSLISRFNKEKNELGMTHSSGSASRLRGKSADSQGTGEHAMLTMSNAKAVVIDNGTGTCKLGYTGDFGPKSIIPTVVGRRKSDQEVIIGVNDKDAYVGYEAKQKRSMLKLRYPIENGEVKEWDDLEKLWHYCFYNQLKVKPQEYKSMFTESPQNSKHSKEKMAEMMFEKFGSPSIYIAKTSVLALYASARTIGVVIDSGDGLTYTVPIYEGYALPHAILSMNIAGDTLTRFLMKLLQEHELQEHHNHHNHHHTMNSSSTNHFFNTLPSSSHERFESVKILKERYCTVALDFETALNEVQTNPTLVQKYELPDGTKVKMGGERFRCPEALFQPSTQLHLEVPGLHEVTYNSIQKCDPDIRKELFANIVLAGGTTMFENIDKRLTKEIESLAPKGADVIVDAPPERRNSVWIGGSILSSLFEDKHWINKDEYKEEGPLAVHKKSF